MRRRRFNTLPIFLSMMKAREAGNTEEAERLEKLFQKQRNARKRSNLSLRGRPMERGL